MSTFSSTNFTEGNIVLKERTKTINNKMKLTSLPSFGQKFIKIGGNMTKFGQKQFCSFFRCTLCPKKRPPFIFQKTLSKINRF